MTRRTIQGKGGDSLADLYNVRGSQVNVDALEDSPVILTHEMGHVLASEKLGVQVLQLDATGVSQSSNFDLANSTVIPRTPFRILSAYLFTPDAVASFLHVQVSLGNAELQREVPLAAWEAASDGSASIRLLFDGTVTNLNILRPGMLQVPTIGVGTFRGDLEQETSRIAIRGVTAAFGAGTVDVHALLEIASTDVDADIQSTSSAGLPIPSW